MLALGLEPGLASGVMRHELCVSRFVVAEIRAASLEPCPSFPLVPELPGRQIRFPRHLSQRVSVYFVGQELPDSIRSGAV